MHLMVCVVSIATALIFNKCEPVARVSLGVPPKYLRRPTIGLKRFLELECHNAQGDHSFMEVRLASKYTEEKEMDPLVFGSLDDCGRKE